MIPYNLNFAKQHGYGILKRQIVQGAPVAINVSAKAKVGKNLLRLTMASDPLATKWAAGMKAMLRTSVNANLNAYEITMLDHTNNYIFVKCDDPNALVGNSNIANAIPYGLVPIDFINDGVELKNNDGETLAIRYDEDAYFILKKTSKKEDITIQIVNYDSVTTMTNVIVKMSLDTVHWLDFPVTLQSGTIAAGASAILIVDLEVECWLRIEIDSAEADYYILAR